MVLFTNICVGQQVEVKWRGRILPGTVKYKGCLNGIAGDWVGVALNVPVGKHDGMICGRRYFQCSPGHGIFTTASKIRFIRMKRLLYNGYRTVDPETIVEEELFATEPPEVKNGPRDPIFVSEDFTNVAQSLDKHSRPSYSRPKSHPLRHSLSSFVPSATMSRPETARSAYYTYRSSPVHMEYDDDYDDFIPSPSIPKTHMPHTALREQVRRGWERAHYVREMSVHTGRDQMKYLQWNDTSP